MSRPQLARPVAHRHRLRHRRVPARHRELRGPARRLRRRRSATPSPCSACRCSSAPCTWPAASPASNGPWWPASSRCPPAAVIVQGAGARRRLVAADHHPARPTARPGSTWATACSRSSRARRVRLRGRPGGPARSAASPTRCGHWAIPQGPDDQQLHELLGLPDTRLADIGRPDLDRARPADHPASGGARRRPAPGAARPRHAVRDGRAARPHHRPRGADGPGPGADRRRRLRRGDRAAPARTRHPRRAAAAAGPAGDGPRPGPAPARHRPGRGPRHRRRGADADPRDAGRTARAVPRASRRRSWSTAGWSRRVAALAGRCTVPVEVDWPGLPAMDRRPGWTRPWRTPPTSWSPRR